MSIATDLRGYADTAVNTGRQAFGTAFDAASNQVSHAGETVQDLRSAAGKAVNIDALTTAVEPYVAQLRQYSTAVTDRFGGVVGDVVGQAVITAKQDKRIGQFVTTAETLTGLVITTVNDRVVKPVVSLTGQGRGRASTQSTATNPRTATRKPATTRKAAPTKATTKPANKPAARKTTARKATAGATAGTTSASTTGSSATPTS